MNNKRALWELFYNVSGKQITFNDFAKAIKVGGDASYVGTDDNHEISVIQLAACCKEIEYETAKRIVPLLVMQGADIDDMTGGWAPIHYAAIKNNYNMFNTLEQLGADMSLKNERGQTALDIIRNERTF